MDKNSLVSIAMTTYNGEKYLKEQLDSIYAQTYKHIEVVVTDDGSTDNTVSILEGYANTYGLRYYINKKRLGYVKNFEKAISLCQGAYIALSDQDDIWYEERLEMYMKHIQDADLVFSEDELIDENGNSLGFLLENVQKVEVSDYRMFFYNCHIYGHSMLFRKELVNKIVPIPDIGYDAWIAIVAAKYGKVKFLDRVLTKYRQHFDSVSGYIRRERSLFDKIFHPIDWRTYKRWNEDRLRRLRILKEIFPEDRELIVKMMNYYSHTNRLQAVAFALIHINEIVNQKGLLRKIKYILLPLIAPKSGISRSYGMDNYA